MCQVGRYTYYVTCLSVCLSAVHHNDCMYIAHHLMLLGHQLKPHLPLSTVTFIDLVPVLRRSGTHCFIDQMSVQRTQLIQCLNTAHGLCLSVCLSICLSHVHWSIKLSTERVNGMTKDRPVKDQDTALVPVYRKQQEQQTSNCPHCRVLPPGNLNSMVVPILCPEKSSKPPSVPIAGCSRLAT